MTDSEPNRTVTKNENSLHICVLGLRIVLNLLISEYFFLKKICVVIAIDAKIVHLIYFTAFFKKQIELNGHDDLHNELQLVISVMVGLKKCNQCKTLPESTTTTERHPGSPYNA